MAIFSDYHKRELPSIADIKPGDHLCCIYETEEELMAVIIPFLLKGIKEGEKIFYIVDLENDETLHGYLQKEGIDTEGLKSKGQLNIFTSHYIIDRFSDRDGMISFVKSETEKALNEGYKALRVTGEITGVFQLLPGNGSLIDDETGLNNFLPGTRCMAICQYDRRRFSPEVIMNVMNTHPFVIMKKEIYDNFYYIPPEKCSCSSKISSHVNKLIKNLSDYKNNMEKLKKQNVKLVRSNKKLQDEIEEGKKTELSLKIKEHAISSCISAIALVDLKSNVTFVNKAFLDMWGYDDEKEVLGKSAVKFFKKRKEYKKVIKALDEKSNWINEMAARRKDGSTFYIQCSASRVLDENGRQVCIMSSFIDINELKTVSHELDIHRIELEMQNLELRENQKNLEKLYTSYTDLYDFSPVGYCTLDARGIIQEINITGAKLLGIERTQLKNIPFNIFMSNSETFFSHMSHCKKYNRELRTEMTLITKERQEIFVELLTIPVYDEEKQKIMYRTSIIDITERKNIEKLLRESEERYRSLVEFSPSGIFINVDNRVVFFNSTFAKLMEAKNPQELLGKDPMFFSHPDYHDIIRERMEHLTEGKAKQSPPVDQKFISLDGRVIDVETTAVSFMFQGKPAIQCAVLDITVRKQIENALKKIQEEFHAVSNIKEKLNLEKQALKTAHLASLGELAAGVAHEINNPVNSIINYAQIILNKNKKKVKESYIAGEIIAEGDRIAHIVKNLLSFARHDSVEKFPINVNEVFSNTMSLIDINLKKNNIKMNINLPESLSRITGNPVEIRQVFLNILSNAQYALNKKYPEDDPNKIIEISGEEIVFENNSYVRICFCDYGCGIPENIQDKVMNPFFSTKPPDMGTGLGLSITYGIIENHKGRLTIDSKEGKFTRVIIDLPSYEGEG
jgi:PAS domain S-box-containing protein